MLSSVKNAGNLIPYLPKIFSNIFSIKYDSKD